MSAQLRFLDTDQSTPITSSNEGNVGSPGTSTQHKVFVDNFGDEDAEELEVEIVQVGTSDGDDYAQIAEDSGGTPGAFSSDPIALGTLTAGSQVAFWLRVSVPAGRTAQNNPRRFDLEATALTV